MLRRFYAGKRMAPQVGLEPTTLRLTAGCSAIELLRSGVQTYLSTPEFVLFDHNIWSHRLGTSLFRNHSFGDSPRDSRPLPHSNSRFATLVPCYGLHTR